MTRSAILCAALLALCACSAPPSGGDGGVDRPDGGPAIDGGADPAPLLEHDPTNESHRAPRSASAIDPITLTVAARTSAVAEVSLRFWDGGAHEQAMAPNADRSAFTVRLPAQGRPRFYRFRARGLDGAVFWLDRSGVHSAEPDGRQDFAIRPEPAAGRVVHYDTGFTAPEIVHDVGDGGFVARAMSPELPGRFGAILQVSRGQAWEFVFHQAGTADWDNPPGAQNYRTALSEAWVRDGVVYDVDPATLALDLIDAHAHPLQKNAGGGYDFASQPLVQLATTEGIDRALTSMMGGDLAQAPLAELARGDPRIVALRWFDPTSDSLVAVESDLRDRGFRGLKFHPAVSNIPADDSRLDPFIQLAAKYDVTVVVHSAIDEPSRPWRVANLALRHPGVRFVLYHLELGAQDKSPAIDEVLRAPNLAVETSWCSADGISAAMARLDSSRVLFGSDATVDGADHYTRPSLSNDQGGATTYRSLLQLGRANLPKATYDNWAWRNAVRVFGLRFLPPPDQLDTDGDGAVDTLDAAPIDPSSR